jgi:hypothetical protein
MRRRCSAEDDKTVEAWLGLAGGFSALLAGQGQDLVADPAVGHEKLQRTSPLELTVLSKDSWVDNGPDHEARRVQCLRFNRKTG